MEACGWQRSPLQGRGQARTEHLTCSASSPLAQLCPFCAMCLICLLSLTGALSRPVLSPTVARGRLGSSAYPWATGHQTMSLGHRGCLR